MKPSTPDGTERTQAAFDPTQLKARFTELWRRCLRRGAADQGPAVWDAVQTSYTEPHRKYHDQRHVFRCLEQLDLASELVRAFEPVELAIWFHDIVNEPGQLDNETRSAARFRELAGKAMAPELVKRVERLILATTHREPTTDNDQQVLCDIDLASFGCYWDCFLRDSVNIQAEFRESEAVYYQQKREAFSAVLRRPRIFTTDFFHSRYEQQARDNIQRYLQLIDQAGRGSMRLGQSANPHDD